MFTIYLCICPSYLHVDLNFDGVKKLQHQLSSKSADQCLVYFVAGLLFLSSFVSAQSCIFSSLQTGC